MTPNAVTCGLASEDTKTEAEKINIHARPPSSENDAEDNG